MYMLLVNSRLFVTSPSVIGTTDVVVVLMIVEFLFLHALLLKVKVLMKEVTN